MTKTDTQLKQTKVPNDLFHDLKDQLNRLSKTNETLQNLVQFTTQILMLNTVDEVLWYLAEYIGESLALEDCVIYITDSHRKVLVQKAAYGNKNYNNKLVTNPIELPFGKGVVGKCASTGEPIIIGDTRDSPDYLIDDVMRLSEISVPIILDKQVIGVIDSENRLPHFYTKEHVSILTTIANIAATKITNSLTIEQLEETIKELEYSRKLQTTLFDIAEISYNAENLFDFGKALHQVLKQLMNCEDCIIGIYDVQTQTLRFPYIKDRDAGMQNNIVVSGKALDKSFSKFVIDQNEPLLLNKEELHEITRNNIFEIQGALPESWLAVPFIVDHSLKGMIAVQNFESQHRFGEKDKELLKFVSQHISTAIKRKFDANLLQFQALHDNLTGLLNRNCFIDRVSHALERQSRQTDRQIALFFLDLDRFKLINDTYGHDVGDILIIEVGQKIKQCLRQSDSLARLGGDEFAVLLEDVSDREEVLQIAQRIIDSIREPVQIKSVSITSNTSIGIAFSGNDSHTPESLIKHADNAMYKAKTSGKGRFVIFDYTLRQEIEHELTVEQDLEKALQEKELELYFQPIVNSEDLEIIALEVLLRWKHGDKGLIQPDNFIPIAEKTELIYQIDRYVMQESINFIRKLAKQNCQIPCLNLNIYSKHFLLPKFSEDLNKLIAATPEAQGKINVEITESALIENMAIARQTIESLRQGNVGIYLDDFGTGYSSLSYIHQLPIDVIKIDRSFVSNLTQEDTKDAIIAAIITLAQALGIKIVAEGVETKQQVHALNHMRCFVMQGFYFHHPQSKDDIIKILTAPKPTL